jgi:hypothetical protein
MTITAYTWQIFLYDPLTDSQYDLSADVRANPHPKWNIGIMTNKYEDRVAGPGYMTFTLNNSISNSAGLAGYYSPGHTNHWSLFVPGKVIFLLTSGANYKFWGWIIPDGIKVKPGIYGTRDVEITVGDFMYWAGKHELRGLEFTATQTLDQLVTAVVLNMPLKPTSTSYAAGTEVFPSIFDLTNFHTTAMSEFVKGAMSELGYIYVNGVGEGGNNLVVENRTTRWNKTSAAAFFAALPGMDVDFGHNLANRVTGQVYPRTTDANEIILGKTDSRIRVAKGQTVTGTTVTYHDPNNKDKTISGYAFHDPPESGVDYKAYLHKTGNDDETVHLVATAVFSADSTVWTLKNTSTTHTIWAYLQVRGKGVYIYDTVKSEKNDTDSQTNSGLIPLTWDAKYLGDADKAIWLATYVLGLKRIPQTGISSYPIWADGNFPNMEPGVLAFFSEDQAAVSGFYYINGYSAELYPTQTPGYANILWKSVLIPREMPALWNIQTTPTLGGLDNQWMSICWSPALALFCAVGKLDLGWVMTSPDGVTWTHQLTGLIHNTSYGIAWSDDLTLFAAVGPGDSNTNRIMTSPDSTNWTAQTVLVGADFRSVCAVSNAGTDKFVTVGHGGIAYNSANGIAWAAMAGISNHNWESVCYSDDLDLLVAVSSDGFIALGTYAGGVGTWSVSAPPAASVYWTSVCWSSELTLFCAVSGYVFGNPSYIMTSPNGVDWTLQTSPVLYGAWDSIAWSPTFQIFMAVGGDGVHSYCMISPDGVNWQTLPQDALGNQWRGVCWSPALMKFAAVSSDGTGNRAMLTI